jgi:uncharacterized protein YbjT (DUF2867 family)
MTILVTGATGTVGRHLVQQLVHMGHPVRALTRNTAKAKFPSNIEVMVGDLIQSATLKTALEGVKGFHLITFGGDDYAPLQTGAEIVEMAERAGVKRVTVLRGATKKGRWEKRWKQAHWTGHCFNLSNSCLAYWIWAKTIREEGVVRLGFVHRKTAIVHEADIAGVAASALTETGHCGKTYWITGGEV